MDLIQVIDNALLEEEKRRNLNKEKRESHYPTSASIKINNKVIGECLLSLYRKWMQIPETNPLSSDALQKMAWGNMFHNWVVSLFQKECFKGKISSILNEERFEIKDNRLKYPITGRIDIILNNSIGVEIKSSYGKFFFSNEGLINTGPKIEYLMQTLIYLKGKPEIEYFVLLYIARDIGFKFAYKVYRNGDSIKIKWNEKGTIKEKEYPEITYENIVQRWIELEKHLESKTEPEKDFKFRSKFPCSWCSYFDLCYPEFKKTNGGKK